MKNWQQFKCDKTNLVYYLDRSLKPSEEIHYLFIHGFGGSSEIWKKFLPYLVTNQWCALDLAGHGKSNNFKIKTIFEMYDLLVTFILNRFNPDSKIILFAHSLGGMLGLRLLVENTIYFKKAILISTDNKIHLHPQVIKSLLKGQIEKGFITSGFLPHISKECIEIVLKSFKELRVEVYDEANFLCLKDWVPSPIETIDIPCVLCIGEKDRIISPRRTRNLAKKIPSAKIYTISNSGHYSFLEDPSNFHKIITDEVL